VIDRDPVSKTNQKTKRPNRTSYETICANALIEPKRAYLELEAHPERNNEYTEKVDQANKKSNE